jgi:hypothetical protein
MSLTELYSSAIFDQYLKDQGEDSNSQGQDYPILSKAYAVAHNLPVTWFSPGQTTP